MFGSLERERERAKGTQGSKGEESSEEESRGEWLESWMFLKLSKGRGIIVFS